MHFWVPVPPAGEAGQEKGDGVSTASGVSSARFRARGLGLSRKPDTSGGFHPPGSI